MLGTYRPYAELVLCAHSAGAARVGTSQFERMARNWTALKGASIRIRKTAVDATIAARYGRLHVDVDDWHRQIEDANRFPFDRRRSRELIKVTAWAAEIDVCNFATQQRYWTDTENCFETYVVFIEVSCPV